MLTDFEVQLICNCVGNFSLTDRYNKHLAEIIFDEPTNTLVKNAIYNKDKKELTLEYDKLGIGEPKRMKVAIVLDKNNCETYRI